MLQPCNPLPQTIEHHHISYRQEIWSREQRRKKNFTQTETSRRLPNEMRKKFSRIEKQRQWNEIWLVYFGIGVFCTCAQALIDLENERNEEEEEDEYNKRLNGVVGNDVKLIVKCAWIKRILIECFEWSLFCARCTRCKAIKANTT